ncbi:ECF RNA polymerase sigma factor SigK [Microcella sp.]|uniref:ECF RNA polymerase sigma factor SigK n=1 Tax=Microcella sp. TaxID=1913979 RepID=UPI00299F622D|nr:ECF RNA polymerase sigma factor SigK [Microcella sp.]MDX2024952.1 ECF RNA polymerase sigma factor SigK [Microcella sp.]
MLNLVPSQEPFDDVDADADATVEAASTLLQRVAMGDQRAFSELYDIIAPRMLGLVRHVLRDHAQSEEVVQEVLLEIWQTAPRFDPNKGKAVTWMLTMTHRRAIDRVRSAQSSRDRDVKIGHRERDREYDSVAENVEIRLEHDRVEKALGRLTELQRQAVELSYYGGYSQSEVSEMLGIPMGTVKTRLRDGMMRLREELGVAS